MDDGFVQCPKKAYNEGSLIVQVIPRPLCLERQAGFYHKCPKCLNRTIIPEVKVPEVVRR